MAPSCRAPRDPGASATATIGAMRHTSTTFDEVITIAAGARGFVTGLFDVVNDHPLLPVNILSRGIIVVAGAPTIDVSYMPPGFIVGFAVSVLTSMVLVLVTYPSSISS